MAFEAIAKELGSGNIEEALKPKLIAGSDAKRGDFYYGILSRIKQLSDMTRHDYGADVVFSRTESLFVVRTTENLLSLIGEFLPDANS